MLPKKPKKTFIDRTAQSWLKSAQVVDGRLLVQDAHGGSYHVQRSTSGTALTLTDVNGCGGAELLMDAWCEAELTWREAQLDALRPGRTVWLLLDAQGSVVGHLAAPEYAQCPEQAHTFRLDNAARRPLPALGANYSPPAEPVRPRRTRGVSAGA